MRMQAVIEVVTRLVVKLRLEKIAMYLDRKLGLAAFLTKGTRREAMRKYAGVNELTVDVGGITMRFSTADEYSRGWFLPRYAGGRLHEESVTRLLLEHLHAGSCFVDVGTNLGWFVCLAGRAVPDAVVYGFDLDESNLKLATNNVNLNGCRNVELHVAAVSDTNTCEYYARPVSGPSIGYAIASDDQRTGRHKKDMMPVNAVSLDAFFADKPRQPDVVKIDVEGGEVKVLKGMARLLGTVRPKLFLELHPSGLAEMGATVADVMDLLGGYGYVVQEVESFRTVGKSVALKPVTDPRAIRVNSMVFAEPADTAR